MMISYSCKVLFANFANMWKVLLYRLIVLVICASLAFGLMYPTVSKIFSLIKDTGIWGHIADFFVGIFTGGVNLEASSAIFAQDIENIIAILWANIGGLILTYIYLIIVFCISRFLNGLCDYSVSDVVNCNMAASAKFSFTACMIRNIGKASVFTLARMLFTVPFDIAIATFIVYLVIALLAPLGFFMPFVVMLIAIILISFRISLFSGWLPAVVVDGNTVFGGLKKGMKATFSRFWLIVSSVVMMLFAIIFLSVLLTLFTCGVGIIVIFPSVVLFMNIFCLVMYYGAEGKRYYIDHETIVTPKKLFEIENRISYRVKNNVFYDNTHIDEEDDED